MNLIRALAATGFGTVFVVGVVVMGAGGDESSPNAQGVRVINLLEDDPLAKFAKLMPAIMAPRCVNCHGGTDPFTGVNHEPRLDTINAAHRAEADRVRNQFGDHDFRNVENADRLCKECHTDKEAPQWFLAPKRMAFLNETPRKICSMWQLDKNDSGPDLMKHLVGDTLIKVAFKGSKGIVDNPPDPLEPIRVMTIREFLDLADKWLKSGNGDIPCAGWEGTITQTERVSLSTTHGGTEMRVSETQEATRTVSIVIGGTVTFKIAVQGVERSNTTIVASQGNQSCMVTERVARVYGTENGETSGAATAATLAFLPGGAFALTVDGPGERTVSVERRSGSHCSAGAGPEETETLPFDHLGWTLSIHDVLPNPSDRTHLQGSKTETITSRDDAWLTAKGGNVGHLQARDNGDLLPVPVEVTTTWDLRRRE